MALLTNVLAAQGRALLTGATAVIGQRFHDPKPSGQVEGGEGEEVAQVLGAVARVLGIAPRNGGAPVGAFGAQTR